MLNLFNEFTLKIQDLRSAEIAAESRGDIDLLIQLKEERLLLELEVVRFAKKGDNTWQKKKKL